MDAQNVGKSTMTKADIVEKVYEKIGFSKKEAAELVELVFDCMKDALHQGEKVKISAFGNFVVNGKHERLGRNPRTGEPMMLKARRVVKFKYSQVLKAMLNGQDVSGMNDDND